MSAGPLTDRVVSSNQHAMLAQMRDGWLVLTVAGILMCQDCLLCKTDLVVLSNHHVGILGEVEVERRLVCA